MKTIISVVLFFFVLSIQAQEQKQALDSFNQIVDKFNVFFKIPQKLICKQTFPDSPTGVVVVIMEYHGKNLSYDIKKTESLVSPLIGFIEIDFTDKSNASCGNVFYTISGKKTFVGWDTEKGAIDNSNISKCYDPQIRFDGRVELSFVDKVRFEFSYQNSKWVFKTANRTEYNTPTLAISGALGLYPDPNQPLIDKESIEFNAKWMDLIN